MLSVQTQTVKYSQKSRRFIAGRWVHSRHIFSVYLKVGFKLFLLLETTNKLQKWLPNDNDTLCILEKNRLLMISRKFLRKEKNESKDIFAHPFLVTFIEISQFDVGWNESISSVNMRTEFVSKKILLESRPEY